MFDRIQTKIEKISGLRNDMFINHLESKLELLAAENR